MERGAGGLGVCTAQLKWCCQESLGQDSNQTSGRRAPLPTLEEKRGVAEWHKAFARPLNELMLSSVFG